MLFSPFLHNFPFLINNIEKNHYFCICLFAIKSFIMLEVISVIIPAYNSESTLESCVASVLNQTYRETEIIIVDDGSVDGTLMIGKRLSSAYDNVRVESIEHAGPSAARNTGLRLARGRYIAFVDSDDFITPDYVEVMYNRICNDKYVGIVSGMIYRYTDGQTTPFKKLWDIKDERITQPADFSVNCINLSISFTVWNKIYREGLVRVAELARSGKYVEITDEDRKFYKITEDEKRIIEEFGKIPESIEEFVKPAKASEKNKNYYNAIYNYQKYLAYPHKKYEVRKINRKIKKLEKKLR